MRRDNAENRFRMGPWAMVLLYGLGIMSTLGALAPPPSRPEPSKGRGATTLLAYSDTYTPYSLVDAVESLALQLRRMNIALQTVPVAALTSNHLARADYLVVFCPQQPGPLPAVLLKSIWETNRPVLWIGHGVEQLEKAGPVAGLFQVVGDQPGVMATEVIYRGRTWSIGPTLWLPIEIPSTSNASVLVSLANTGTPPRPACWRAGHITVFASLPGQGVLGHLFSDLLLDFFGADPIPPSCLVLRLEDYHPLSDHNRFLRMVDFLHARGIPFLVAVTPAARDEQTGRIEDLDSSPEFVSALQYAQRRGGRMVLRGCLRGAADTGEFWNMELDRPLPVDAAKYVRDMVAKSCQQLVRHGVLPLAWETPQYAASGAALKAVAQFFSTAVERVQLSDATRHAVLTPVSLTSDRFGRLILPENLGFFPGDNRTPDTILGSARVLLELRGVVAGCYVHVHLPLDRLITLVDYLESRQLPFLDLVDMDHWVRWPGGLLLTGRSHLSTLLSPGRVRWRAYNRVGELAGETTARTLFSGERTFERRGLGVVEVFEAVAQEQQP